MLYIYIYIYGIYIYIYKSPFILWVCSWSWPQSLKTQAFSFRLGSTRVFLTCVAEVYKGNSFSVALARLGPDQTTKWPDPHSPRSPGVGRGGGVVMRSGNEVIFLIALAMAFLDFFAILESKNRPKRRSRPLSEATFCNEAESAFLKDTPLI